jgi:UDP:flavonoid glycosyltransferase YjiC (YdhE family)
MPLVPLARAFVARGDEVVFATAGGFAGRVGGFGFDVLPAGLTVVELNERYAPFRERLATIPFDERRAHAFAWRFAGLDAPAKVAGLLDHARSWAPDLIVHESSDLAAPAVATAVEVDSAHHTFGLGLPRVCLDRAVPALESLWHKLGLEPEPHGGLFRGTYIDVGPPSLMPAEPPAGTHVVPLRPATRGSAPAEWQERLGGDKPVVYVTLGTQFNGPDRFALLLEAVGTVDCTAVVTVGADQDPAALRPPAHMIVERYIPQADVLPLTDAVVCHGGSGSMLAALAHGLPLVLLPAGADQFENAGACSRAGAAIELRPPSVTVDSIRSAVTSVLEDGTFAEAAEGLAAEIERMLTPAEVAAILS